MSKDAKNAALAIVNDAHKELVVARAELRGRIEQEFEKQLSALRLKEAIAAAEAQRTGASVSAIGRAMGTTDWNTIKGKLALGNEYLTPTVEATETTGPYTWTDRTGPFGHRVVQVAFRAYGPDKVTFSGDYEAVKNETWLFLLTENPNAEQRDAGALKLEIPSTWYYADASKWADANPPK